MPQASKIRLVPIELLALGLLIPGVMHAQMQPMLGENTVKVSEHVWAIMGFPNIGIVVGSKGVLVVDTGLGPRNGATAARVASRLSSNARLYLTTTHFHPEHAGGEPGFPPATILIRNAVQERDMQEHGDEMLEFFRGMSAQNKELLAGVKLRPPDITFDREARLDLGGVAARLLWFGEAHTKGDELILVEPDQTLISGDVVQNKTVPAIFRDGGTPATWLAVLDQIAKLDLRHVLPDHSPVGDGSLVTTERAFIATVHERAQALQRQGVSAEEAGKRIAAELKEKYPDWPNLDRIGDFVQRVYTEKR
ncbi:MAG: MBL fold metallo-hydrolase [Acidobacteriia bacterium]|nr:MBL fold metallo-hydrolase [Terriglobia bacterium]